MPQISRNFIARPPACPLKRTPGFTLVELLAVIAIIGVLVAILLPVIGRMRDSAHSSRCFANLRNIHTWLNVYAADHKGSYPAAFAPAPGFPNGTQYWTTLLSYMNSSPTSALVQNEAGEYSRFWYCPAAANTFPEEPHRVYPINAFGRSQSSPIRPLNVSQPARTLLLADGSHNPGGGGNSLAYFRDSTASATERPAAALEARHRGKANGIFMDGHAATFALTDPNLETWITNLAK
jgi:prepilin-type N-terminal cleavage/methylation domain-containing protein/prepilin-type processing-associated H-X9-DG protein